MLLLTAKNCLTILCYDKTITNLTISCQKPKCSFLKTSGTQADSSRYNW